MSTHAYSDLFACLYDQNSPIGSFGRGAHYSVFRSVQWRDADGDPMDSVRVHDFAVIWDEDHDRRIINVVTALQMSGLLWPVLFIGERKGAITLVIDPVADLQRYQPHWEDSVRDVIANVIYDDDWRVEVGRWHHSDMARVDECVETMVDDDHIDVWHFLGAVAALWQIGCRWPQRQSVEASNSHKIEIASEMLVSALPSLSMHPGEFIREVLLPEYGLSVSEVARRIGADRATLSNVFHGKHDVSRDLAYKLGALLNDETADLLVAYQHAYDLERERDRREAYKQSIERAAPKS
jgi:addiction module HigA family antidote